MKKDPAKKRPVAQLDQTIRFRSMGMGTMAPSPRRMSHASQMRNVAPAPQKRPMTVELFQAYWFPPYWSARRN